MGDEDGTPSSSNSAASTIPEAELRRLRRRQRILENQESRLQRILNTDSSSSHKRDASLKSKSSDDAGEGGGSSTPPIEIFQKTEEGIKKVTGKSGISGDRPSSSSASASSIHSNRQSSQGGGSGSGETPNLSSLLQELSGGRDLPEQRTTTGQVRLGVQSDGTVLLPKISYRLGRILICVLALFLSLFNAKHYLVTFLSWEFAFYWVNGLPPAPPPNMVMVLVALMGLRESQLYKLKVFAHIINCVMVDFALFLMCVLLPHVISSVIHSYG